MKGRMEKYQKIKAIKSKIAPRSYDVVGDIAVIRESALPEWRIKESAFAILKTNKHIKTVLRQNSPISGNLRLRKLRWVAGERKNETIHKEWGCYFKVDLERCYFSPRLAYERMRIARQVKSHEIVVNMFAGVGCFSILIARTAKPDCVYSIDINPAAILYSNENVKLNRVKDLVIVIKGDSKEIVAEKMQNIADRVLMPLPRIAFDYMEYAIMALKKVGIIHYYDLIHAKRNENPVGKSKSNISEKMRELNTCFDLSFSRIVRTVGPGWFQVVHDINVH